MTATPKRKKRKSRFDRAEWHEVLFGYWAPWPPHKCAKGCCRIPKCAEGCAVDTENKEWRKRHTRTALPE